MALCTRVRPRQTDITASDEEFACVGRTDTDSSQTVEQKYCAHHCLCVRPRRTDVRRVKTYLSIWFFNHY
jgi:hypothetical protein